MVVVSVYVGYFGAGGGFLVMALFGICGVHDIHEMNALKVLTAAVSIGIPAVTFILAGRWSGASAWRWRFLRHWAAMSARTIAGINQGSCAELSLLSVS